MTTMTREQLEQHAICVGSGLDALFVRAFRASVGGVSAFETDDSWHPLPGLDDLYLRGEKGRRRYSVGKGVFQVGDGPARSVGHDSVLILGVEAAVSPSKRSLLHFGELLVGGAAVARWSITKCQWHYLDRAASGAMLTLGPPSFLGPPEIQTPGRLSRLSSLSRPHYDGAPL